MRLSNLATQSPGHQKSGDFYLTTVKHNRIFHKISSVFIFTPQSNHKIRPNFEFKYNNIYPDISNPVLIQKTRQRGDFRVQTLCLNTTNPVRLVKDQNTSRVRVCINHPCKFFLSANQFQIQIKTGLILILIKLSHKSIPKYVILKTKTGKNIMKSQITKVTMSLFPRNNCHFIHIYRSDHAFRTYQRDRQSKAFKRMGNVLEHQYKIFTKVTYLRATTFIDHHIKRGENHEN